MTRRCIRVWAGNQSSPDSRAWKRVPAPRMATIAQIRVRLGAARPKTRGRGARPEPRPNPRKAIVVPIHRPPWRGSRMISRTTKASIPMGVSAAKMAARARA